jgi:hypothetical protein
MFKHMNQKEQAQSGPRLPHKHAKETEREREWANFTWSSIRPDAGHFIAHVISTTSMLRKHSELKGAKESMNRTRG